MKGIFITGASGRIGRHVIPLLINRGYRVRVGVHRSGIAADWMGDVEIVQAPLPGTTLDAALADIDAVVHLAGIMPPASDDEAFRTNIEGTFQMLQAIATHDRKPLFVFASSDATYCTGWSLNGYSGPIEENAAQHPTVFYGLSKVLGERMCLYYEELHKIPIVRLRFVWTLAAPEILGLFTKAPYRDFLLEEDRGKWDDPGVVAIPLEEDGCPFTEHVCDVRDAADAVVLALESSSAPGHAFNIAGPAAFRYTETGPTLATRMGLRTVEARCHRIHSYSLSIEKARAVLGYRPRFQVMDSLDDALMQATW
jgi:nucleoside-diphosphate-sugar epimerase